jgi:hypothetical protein
MGNRQMHDDLRFVETKKTASAGFSFFRNYSRQTIDTARFPTEAGCISPTASPSNRLNK